MPQWRASVVASIIGLSFLGVRVASGQLATIHGAVVDSATGIPLSGVRVTSLSATNKVAANDTTDGRGRFRLTGLAPSPYTLLFKRAGYADRRVFGVMPSESTELAVVLTPRRSVLEPMVTSASRAPETRLDAPVAISVIERQQIERDVGFTPLDYIRTTPGMDFGSKGIIQQVTGVRSVRPLTNQILLTLVDDRRTTLPNIGATRSYLLSTTNDDIERIEVVRGPGAALYGPGAARGVVSIITRSPFESRGATFTLASGQRGLFEGTARVAQVLSPKTAVKVSASWLQARDWGKADSSELALRRKLIDAGADSSTLLIGRRDFNVRRLTSDARFDWRPGDATTFTGAVGGTEAFSVIEASGGGNAVQVRDARFGFAQARLQSRRFFANATYNVNDAGRSYNIGSGAPMIDNSRQASGQLQHGLSTDRIDLLYGADGRWTNPITGGTVSGRNEDDDQVMEAGSYAQARLKVSPRFDLVTAVRTDYNDRMNDFAISPRVAAILKPAPGHALRLTYNRAFSNPEANQLFMDQLVTRLPFVKRLVAVPQSGFSFRRDCGGICMRSPFHPGGPGQYVATDATIAWDSVVARVTRAGKDMSGIPRPTSGQVATRLSESGPSSPGFLSSDASQIVDLPGRTRSINETVELGYRGTLSRPLALSMDVYAGRVTNPTGSVITVTRNVFYDSTTLARYLGGFRSADDAARLAAMIDTIRVGAVSPREARDPFEILTIRRQGGAYTTVGTDIGITAALGSRLSFEGNYSWINQNVFYDVNPNDPLGSDIALNVPRSKGAAAVRYHDDDKGLFVVLEGRAIGSFDWTPTDGHVVPYSVLDALFTYELPWATGVSVSVKASNLLNTYHQELSAQPMIGRFVVARVRVKL